MRQRRSNILSSKIPRGIVYHSLRTSVRYVFLSLYFPLQQKELVAEAEAKFALLTKSKNAISFPLARTAIYFALKSQPIKPGDEILMSPVTIKGILEVVLALGLKPVYVDFAPGTACFDVNDLERKIGPQTTFCLITPLFGMVPDLQSIHDVLNRHQIFSIVDFSQCLNGTIANKPVNNFADIGVYSASSLKTVDTLGGGFLISNSAELAQQLRRDQEKLSAPSRFPLIKKAILNLARNFAVQRIVFSTLTFWYLRLLSFISPETALKQTGKRKSELNTSLPSSWFTKYSSLQAKILLEQIERVQATDQLRVKNAKSIIASTPSSQKFLEDAPNSRSVFWQLVYVSENAICMQHFMASRGIDVATSSLSFLPALKHSDHSCPNAYRVYTKGVFVPHSHLLTVGELKRVETAMQHFAELQHD